MTPLSLNRCWAEIDASALAANIVILKKFRPKIMAVVKADAYGHGASIIVPQLRSLGIEHFAVATVAEAQAVRAVPNLRPFSLYLMAAVVPDDAEEVVRLDVIPFSTDTAFVTKLSDAAVEQGKTAQVHIEIDTGIGRAGIDPERLSAVFELWQNLPGIQVTGICTHFAAADSTDPEDSLLQLKWFERAVAELPTEQLAGLAIHSSNSPAAMRLPNGISTLFRPGLLIYGIAPADSLSFEFPFLPVMSLKARVLLVRRLKKGTDISYSRTYRLSQDATIATIGIGYGDGYPRRLSNCGRVLLPDGTYAPIRGRVCMDQMCVEVPDGVNLSPGDVVTVLGKVGLSEIRAHEIASLIDATPHEITTCLTARIPRIVSPA